MDVGNRRRKYSYHMIMMGTNAMVLQIIREENHNGHRKWGLI
jgi:hypothetical protein